MDINVSKLAKWASLVIGVGIIGFNLYLGYVVFFTGPKPEETPSLAAVNAGLFNDKVQKVVSALNVPAQKVNLKSSDLRFTQSALYKSFDEFPIDVPLSDSRGRPDPFVPYAAP